MVGLVEALIFVICRRRIQKGLLVVFLEVISMGVCLSAQIKAESPCNTGIQIF